MKTKTHQKHPEGGTLCGSNGSWSWVSAEVDCEACKDRLKPAMKRAIAAARQVGLLPLGEAAPIPKPVRHPPQSHWAVHSALQPAITDCKRESGKWSLRVSTVPAEVTCSACCADLARYPQLGNRMQVSEARRAGCGP